MEKAAREGRFRKQISRPEYDSLRRELRSELDRTNVSQRGLSNRLGMKSSYVNKIVMGQRAVEFAELLDILAELGVEPLEFLSKVLGSPPTQL